MDDEAKTAKPKTCEQTASGVIDIYKKIALLFTSLIFIVLISGCSGILPERREIDKLMMIRAVGVDKGEEDPEKICVTVISKRTGESVGEHTEGAAGSKSEIMSNEADTFLEAERQFQTVSDNTLFFGHCEYYLFGEEAAKEGIVKYLDFLSRDHEMRGNAYIYIVEGSTAKEFITKSSNKEVFMPERLEIIGENSKLVTGAKKVELVEFVLWLNNKYSCAVAPTLKLKEKDKETTVEGQGANGEDGGKEQKTSFEIELTGYSVFKDFKLKGILDKKMTRGENFLLNRVASGVIEVRDRDGNMVALEIIDSSTSFKPEFENDEIKKVSINIKLSTNVDEIHSKKSVFTEDTLAFLMDEQSKVIKEEVESVISYAQEINTDFIEIANVIETKHPAKWQNFKDRWDEVFPNLEINVEVKSRINRTYDIREPNGVLEEEHK